MTIVETHDTRNVDWTKSNVGSRLLEKMGWSEGQGIGKRRQESSPQVALRAVRRTDETLGIGASTSDAQGSQGWSSTSHSFTAVLDSLQAHHNTSDSGETSKKKKKRKRDKHNLTLAKNKVTAGHAQKMRHAKDLSNKSDTDMAAIFGTQVVTTTEKKKKNEKQKHDEEPTRRKEKKNKKKRKGETTTTKILEKKKKKKRKKE